jgi:CRP-like cAMP-binding protein
MIRIMFDEFFATAKPMRRAAGQNVFRQGMPVTRLYRVTSGRVRLLRHLAEGTAVTVALAEDGETIAEASLFTERYHCDAFAETACELAAIPAAAIRNRLAADARAGVQLAALFAGQVRDLRARLEMRNIRGASERLLAWLRYNARGKPPQIALQRSWRSVASEIGLTPEATYRALTELQRTGFIDRRARSVTLRSGKG